MKDTLLTCKACGWVAFGVTREFAEEAVKRFNDYYGLLSPEKQRDYYGGHNASIRDYERCISCGNEFTNFRNAVDGDCPYGCTLNPIIMK